jgi:glycosyltransferase involved in cell wall biosynthesis
MKILIVQDHLRSGGTERQSLLLARSFLAEGESVRLLTFRPGGALESEVGAIPRISLQPFDTQLDWFAPDLDRAVARFAPDIVLCMGRMANCYAGRIQRRNPDSAVVATMRTGKALPWLFRRSLIEVAQVVANSEEAKTTLVRDHGVDPDRIAVIYNGLVFAAGRPAASQDRAAERARHGAKDATCVLLSVAMFRPEKGQAELLATVAQLPRTLDWQLWLAGDGPALDACRHVAASLGLADRVRFLGWQASPASLYAAADIAVHASTSEALSNFLIEAQASGLPAVAFNAQGIGECFLPNITGYVIPRGDPAAFVEAVTRFAGATAAERFARSEQARKFARERFDPTQQTRSYLRLFTSLRTRPPS